MRAAVRLPMMNRSRDDSLGAQCCDLGLAIAGLAQPLVAVLADGGGAARRHLVLARNKKRAVDRPQIGIVGIGPEKTGRERLLVMADVVDPPDHPENQPGIVERLAPMSE